MLLSRQYPSLNLPSVAPELRTALRQIQNHVYQLRDQAATENIDAETPNGPQNSVNLQFQLAFPPAPASSLQLFRNGLLLLAGTDFTLMGKNVEYIVAPASTDWHRAYYRRSTGTNDSTP